MKSDSATKKKKKKNFVSKVGENRDGNKTDWGQIKSASFLSHLFFKARKLV